MQKRTFMAAGAGETPVKGARTVRRRRRKSASKLPRTVTFTMLDRHVAYLDMVAIFIRLRQRKALSRAELLRAFVEFMERSGIDFTRFATREEMVRYLAAYFRAINRGRLPLLIGWSLAQMAQREQAPETTNVAAR